MKNKTLLEKTLFSSKWLLIPFYIGLIISLAVFAYIDIKETFHMITCINGVTELDGTIHSMTEEDGMMMLLKLIDLTMIANLVKLIIVGSYTSFFKKHVDEEGTTDPNLNTSSGVLKVKMATALIGVSSINLLQTFIKPGELDTVMLNKQLIIHGAFLLGALVLAAIDWLHVKAEAIHHEDCIKHNDIIKHKKH